VGPNAAAKSLSGGNLQKFIVGREIDANPKLLIVSQPTWGVDVGAAAQIRGEILALRDAGCAVLVVSEELDELFEISDRLHVIAKGRLSPSVPGPRPRVEIGEWMSGLWHAEVPRGAGGPRMLKLEPRPAAVEVLELWLAAAGAGDHRGHRRGCCSPRWARTRCGPAGVLLGAHQDALRLGELMVKATPLLVIALGLAVCFRSNVWNIGAEGQFVIGAVFAGGVALLADKTTGGWIVLAILLAACWAAWSGRADGAAARPLQCQRNPGQPDAGVRGRHGAELPGLRPLEGPMGYNFPQTKTFEAVTQIPRLMQGSRVSIGLLALAGRRGAVGVSVPHAGRLCPAGGRAGPGGGALRRLFVAQGAVDGVADLRWRRPGWRVRWRWQGPSASSPLCAGGYGFAAIIVAFVGRLHPVGMVFSAMLMSMFYIGGELAQSRLGLPKSLTGVFQGLLLFTLLACDTLIAYRCASLGLSAVKGAPLMESYALLLAATLNAGTVLAIAALGLLINEKAGIVNLGAEGMMLCAAIAGLPRWCIPATTGWALPPAWAPVRCWRRLWCAGDLAQHQPVRHRAGAQPVWRRLLGLCRHQLRAGKAARAAHFSVPLLGDIPLLGPALFRQHPHGVPDHGCW
jgi:ABC-type uncharacterized transport system permease subunit